MQLSVFAKLARRWGASGGHALEHAGMGASLYQVVCSVPASVTGTTQQVALGIVTIPAANLSPNCRIKVEAFFSANSSTNNRTPQILVNEAGAGLISADAFYNAGSGSNNYGAWSVSASLFIKSDMSTQIGGLTNSYSGVGTVLSAPSLFNHNAANGLDIVFAVTNGASADYTTLESYLVQVQK